MRTREIALQHNQALPIRGAMTVECVAGTVWLTSADRAGDVFLHAGESFAAHGRGLMLIEALGAARVVLQPPLSRWTRTIAVAKRCFLLSSPHERMRTMRFPRWRNHLAG